MTFGRSDRDMRVEAIPVQQALGRVLFSTVFRSSGRKLIARGHTLSPEDVGVLSTEGLSEVWVAKLEDDEVGEDTAVLRLAEIVGQGPIEIRPTVGGRANLFAMEQSVLLLEADRLRDVNSTPAAAVSTLPPYSFVTAGERFASIKCAPFAVRERDLEALEQVLRSGPPVLRLAQLSCPRVAILFCDPLQPARATEQFGHVLRQRLDAYGVRQWSHCRSVEEDEPLIRSLLHLLKQEPAVILVASTTAPAGPEDAVGRAIQAVGGVVERFLAPVEPGNLALLAYHRSVAILSAPGCLRNVRPNVLNLLLPPLLAGHRVSGREIAGLGPGGLLGN
jgi:molybdenum cofactor cytidylyltransferase